MNSEYRQFDWSGVFGFNYQPSYGRDVLEIWLYKYDAAQIVRELKTGKKYFPKMNAVRLWLSYQPFYYDSVLFMKHFEEVLAICAELNLKAIPVLFNNWHSFPPFGGIAPEMIGYWFKAYGQSGTAPNYLFKPYLDMLWGTYSQDERILAWDICNEPYNNYCPEIDEWLFHTWQWGKNMKVGQPISVSLQADISQLRKCQDFSDIFMIHPYFAKEQNIQEILSFTQSLGKSVLATECCWGSMDDAQRVEYIRNDLSILSTNKIGFLPHALQESLVADLHRPQYAPFGITSSASYMAFINMDGGLRKGHEAYNEYCR
jgi:hypothetical protein